MLLLCMYPVVRTSLYGLNLERLDYVGSLFVLRSTGPSGLVCVRSEKCKGV